MKLKTLKELAKIYITEFHPRPDPFEKRENLQTFEIIGTGYIKDFIELEELDKRVEMPNLILDTDIKQEAIKHIKNMEGVLKPDYAFEERRYNKEYSDNLRKRVEIINLAKENKIGWLKWFFNITKKDLK